MESSNHSFSHALKVYLEHDLSLCLHPCGILVQEVSDERDHLFLMSSIFAIGTRQMTEDCGFSFDRISVALFICCAYSQIISNALQAC